MGGVGCEEGEDRAGEDVGGFHRRRVERMGVCFEEKGGANGCLFRGEGPIGENFGLSVKCLFKSLMGKVMGEMGGKIFFALWGVIG